jgi:hypothetical protein
MTEFTDHKISLVFEGDTEETILRMAKEGYPNKTGGILVGRYTADNSCACVTEILPPSPDSKIGPAEFHRGVEGVQEALHERWDAPERTYYLGEWHSHPNIYGPQAELNIEPGALDIQTMVELADDPKTACPQPMLVIVGIWATEDRRSMVHTKLGVYGFDRGSNDFVRLNGVASS